MLTLRVRLLAVAFTAGLMMFSFPAEATADVISIELTSDSLGLGGDDINYDKNGNALEADRPGQLVTSTEANAGSVLTIQADGTAGAGSESNKLLVTVTAKTHMDVQANLPAGYDFQGGIITLTDHDATRDELAKEGLGVRAFGIDLDPNSATYGQRYVNDSYKQDNTHGYQMEGSKEVSGGVAETDWYDFVAGQPETPDNAPPHVDEYVLFDFNEDELSIAANGVSFLLTKVKAGSGPMDLSLDVEITLADGSTIVRSYDYLSDAPDVFSTLSGYADVIQMDLSGASLGLASTDLIDSIKIGAKDDPADDPRETDEHFLINGFTLSSVSPAPIPEPATATLLGLAAVGVIKRRRRR